MIKLLVTGATGTAGSEVVRQALIHPSVSQVTVLVRRPLPPHIAPSPDNPKLRTIIHKDFTSYPPELLKQLEGTDAVIWAQGVSSNGFKEADYEVITREYPLAAAEAFAGLRKPSEPKLVFAYVSGDGANQEDGKAWAMFGRVKGRAEKALALFNSTHPTLATYSFRPAGIDPIHPVPEAPRHYQIMNKWLLPVMRKVTPSYIITTETLANGLIAAAVRGSSGSIAGWEGKGQVGNANVFNNEEIKKLAAEPL